MSSTHMVTYEDIIAMRDALDANNVPDKGMVVWVTAEQAERLGLVEGYNDGLLVTIGEPKDGHT